MYMLHSKSWMNNEEVPIGYKFIRCHMIFDVKMEDFRRKSRLVAGGHMTDTPAAITYDSVVSRESVRLALMLAALNALEVKCGDVMNAYITDPINEKIWTILRPKFGADQGKKALIVRALYGLKSAGAAFRTHLCICMKGMGYNHVLLILTSGISLKLDLYVILSRGRLQYLEGLRVQHQVPFARFIFLTLAPR